MTAILGARAGRTSTAETAEAAGLLLTRMKRDRLTLVHAFDRALVDLRRGASPRMVAFDVAEVLEEFTTVTALPAERRAA